MAIGLCGRPTTLEAPQALDHFLAGVERRAFRMAQLATGDRDEALDIVQDSMVKLVQKYANRQESEWAPLFHTIVQSRIKDWHRRNWVRTRWRVWFTGSTQAEENEGDNPIQQIPDTLSADPSEQTERTQAMAVLEQSLRTLPLRQQQAFLLRAWEGCDVAETAQAMGCSEGSVKTHYSRAVHSLRKHLQEFGP